MASKDKKAELAKRNKKLEAAVTKNKGGVGKAVSAIAKRKKYLDEI